MTNSASPLHTLGNMGLMSLHKVAFLCSRKCPAAVVKICAEWASSQRDNGICVISGYHSAIEKEVLHRLLQGTQPIIIALARGIMKELDPAIETAVNAGRLLIITRYADSVTHACEDKCFHRNRMMMEIADHTVVGFAAPGGTLERLCRENPQRSISFLS